MTRKLTLRTQPLAELADGELRDVAAGATTPPGVCVGDAITRTVPLASRVVECKSLLEPCISSTC